MKGIIKTISHIVSIILTVVSCLVFMTGMCVVEMESWSWGGFFAFMGAVAWITYVMWEYDRKIRRTK